MNYKALLTVLFSVLLLVQGITLSDQREKNNITDEDLGLDFINQLRPVKFKYNVQYNQIVYINVPRLKFKQKFEFINILYYIVYKSNQDLLLINNSVCNLVCSSSMS